MKVFTVRYNRPMEVRWIHYDAARIATQLLESAGFEAYIIGGAVRDILLGKTPKDFDLVTNATPEQIQALSGFRQARYQDTSQAYGISRVEVEVPKENQVNNHDDTSYAIELEIATYRRDVEAHMGRKQTKVAFTHLEDDVRRRDFTANALALNLDTNQLIDLTNGLEDIEQRILRFIGEPEVRIQEDPLRILRAIRLKYQLGFTYEPATETALKNAVTSGKLEDIASNRIKFELSAMLTHEHRRLALEELDEFGALEQLLPEVAAQKGVAQPPDLHAEGDVWQHCLLTMQFLPAIISPRLAWAALLHDIGKVDTAETASQTGDRIRFSGHHSQSAELAHQVLKRLGFGKRFRQEVSWIIHYHLAIDSLPDMRPGRAREFMSHPAFADLLQLHKADAHAAWSRNHNGGIDTGPADFSHLERLWQEFQDSQHQHPPSLKHDLGIDGDWLKQQFDLTDGPELGQILHRLQELYLDGEITDEMSAQTHTQKLLRQSRASE